MIKGFFEEAYASTYKGISHVLLSEPGGDTWEVVADNFEQSGDS